MFKTKDKEQDKTAPEAEKLPPAQWILNELKFFAKLFAFILAFWTLVWGHFKIPSESMQPTLEVGDRLYVSKYAYGYSKHSLPLYFINYLCQRAVFFLASQNAEMWLSFETLEMNL